MSSVFAPEPVYNDEPKSDDAPSDEASEDASASGKSDAEEPAEEEEEEEEPEDVSLVIIYEVATTNCYTICAVT